MCLFSVCEYTVSGCLVLVFRDSVTYGCPGSLTATDQADLKFTEILLPLPPEYWDYRRAPHCQPVLFPIKDIIFNFGVLSVLCCCPPFNWNGCCLSSSCLPSSCFLSLGLWQSLPSYTLSIQHGGTQAFFWFLSPFIVWILQFKVADPVSQQSSTRTLETT